MSDSMRHVREVLPLTSHWWRTDP